MFWWHPVSTLCVLFCKRKRLENRYRMLVEDTPAHISARHLKCLLHHSSDNTLFDHYSYFYRVWGGSMPPHCFPSRQGCWSLSPWWMVKSSVQGRNTRYSFSSSIVWAKGTPNEVPWGGWLLSWVIVDKLSTEIRVISNYGRNGIL